MSNLAYQVQPKRQQRYQPNQKPKIKIKKTKRISTGEKLLLSLLVAFSTIGCVFIVSNQATIFELNNDIQSLEANISKQQKLNSGLKQDITKLSTPERVLTIAREQGLAIRNNNVQIIGN